MKRILPSDLEREEFEAGASPKEIFAEAGELMRAGLPVGIPTETVYGLAAWIGSEDGIRRIYEAKGRPSDNPLIVHIWPGCDLTELVEEVPEMAKKLAEAYWPGPMTLVMKKKPCISPRITGGLDTVAIRMPSHPVTKALLTELKMPLVAPSANTSGRPSPTTAQHVEEDLQGKIPLIIDAGPSGVGVESTVIDVTGEYPIVLRPGAVSRAMIEAVLGRAELDPAVTAGGIKDPTVVPRAPGMKYRHYAPKAGITVLNGGTEFWLKQWRNRPNKAKKWAVLASDERIESLQGKLKSRGKITFLSLGSRKAPEEAAQRLFDLLRRMDTEGIELAFAEAISPEGVGEAVMNRLLKAAGGKLENE